MRLFSHCNSWIAALVSHSVEAHNIFAVCLLRHVMATPGQSPWLVKGKECSGKRLDKVLHCLMDLSPQLHAWLAAGMTTSKPTTSEAAAFGSSGTITLLATHFLSIQGTAAVLLPLLSRLVDTCWPCTRYPATQQSTLFSLQTPCV